MPDTRWLDSAEAIINRFYSLYFLLNASQLKLING